MLFDTGFPRSFPCSWQVLHYEPFPFAASRKHEEFCVTMNAGGNYEKKESWCSLHCQKHVKNNNHLPIGMSRQWILSRKEIPSLILITVITAVTVLWTLLKSCLCHCTNTGHTGIKTGLCRASNDLQHSICSLQNFL